MPRAVLWSPKSSSTCSGARGAGRRKGFHINNRNGYCCCWTLGQESSTPIGSLDPQVLSVQWESEILTLQVRKVTLRKVE